MNKKVVFLCTFLVFASLALASSAGCTLSVSLINQDPYPAVPGEYVKVVFQIEGVENPQCGGVKFRISEKFPFSLDPGESPRIELLGGTYAIDYQNYLIAPFKLRIDPDAIDGENEIEVFFSKWSEDYSFRKLFQITLEDSRADFEVSIKDFDFSTNTLSFEILNIGESDVEALTIEVPKQDNIKIKGSMRNIVGGLDSTEDTTFSFEAIPKDGEIRLTIIYTDLSNVRRMLEKTVVFDSSYFEGRIRDQSGTPPWVKISVLITLTILYFYWRKRRKKKRHNLNHSLTK